MATTQSNVLEVVLSEPTYGSEMTVRVPNPMNSLTLAQVRAAFSKAFVTGDYSYGLFQNNGTPMTAVKSARKVETIIETL